MTVSINGHKLAGIIQNLAKHLDSVENPQNLGWIVYPVSSSWLWGALSGALVSVG